ncbi:MAG: PP2C family protein-serine/threonine phosphatase [bacterium]
MSEDNACILFVDDAEMIRLSFSRKLEARGYDVVTAAGGAEALDMIAKDRERFDLILSDIEMPEVDGFALVEALRKDYSKTELPIIMVTASPFSERVVRALKAGANDFIAKENDFTVLVARIETQLSLQKASNDLRDYAQRLQQMNDRKDKELEIGRRIQQELLPEDCPDLELYDFGLKYKPTTELGGDFYNFVHFEDTDKTLIYLADAAGHGVPAALLSAIFKAQADLVLSRYDNFSEALWVLNSRLSEILPGGKFISTFFLILDNQHHKIEFWKCSQEPGLLLIDDRLRKLDTGGILLGAFGPDMIDEENYFSSGKLSLKKGDRIVLYTDGVTEAESPAGEVFGENKFYNLIKNNSDIAPCQFSDHVLAKVQQHTQTEQLADDFSVLTIDLK